MNLNDFDRWIYRLVDAGTAIILVIAAVIVILLVIIGIFAGIFGS